MSDPQSDYVSVIGISWLYPILALLEQLEPFKGQSGNDVQVAVKHNGYAVAVVTQATFIVESFLNRTRLFATASAASGKRQSALEFFRSQFPASGLDSQLEELFVARDVIVHNHLWEAEIVWTSTGMEFVAPPVHQGRPLYGDDKFDKVIDRTNRKTRILGLNLFPTRVCRQDAIIALKAAYGILEYLENQDRRYCYVSHWPLILHGRYLSFSDFIDQLI